jgi:hypothetical protein
MMRGVGVVLVAFGLAVAAASPAFTQGAPTSAELRLARQAENLKPGEWVWAPEIARTGPVLVYVDLGRQRATVYRNGVRIGVSTISSGKDGYETRPGFSPSSKRTSTTVRGPTTTRRCPINSG